MVQRLGFPLRFLLFREGRSDTPSVLRNCFGRYDVGTSGVRLTGLFHRADRTVASSKGRESGRQGKARQPISIRLRVAQGLKEAARWYLLAAKQGDSGAQQNLARLYLPKRDRPSTGLQRGCEMASCSRRTGSRGSRAKPRPADCTNKGKGLRRTTKKLLAGTVQQQTREIQLASTASPYSI